MKFKMFEKKENMEQINKVLSLVSASTNDFYWYSSYVLEI